MPSGGAQLRPEQQEPRLAIVIKSKHWAPEARQVVVVEGDLVVIVVLVVVVVVVVVVSIHWQG